MADFLSEYSKYLGPQAIGGAMSSLFGGGAQDDDAVQSQLGQIPGMISPYYQPYIQAGQESLGGLQEQLGQMTQDPGALMNMLGQGYRQSPGLQMSEQQAIEAANRAAAAGGQLGAPGVQAAIAKQVHGMGEQDYGDYLNRVLGLYGTGVQGLTGLTGLGAQEGAGLAQNLADVQMSQIQNIKNQRQQEQAERAGTMGMFGQLGGAALKALPFLL
jgi:hypothetical protein